MPWFQLLESLRDAPAARRDEPEPRRSTRPAPNSAMFINPRLPLSESPEPRAAAPRLHLVKGSRVSHPVPSAA